MLIQDNMKKLICNGFEFTKSKNGYKNTRELTYCNQSTCIFGISLKLKVFILYVFRKYLSLPHIRLAELLPGL